MEKTNMRKLALNLIMNMLSQYNLLQENILIIK